MYLQNYSGTFKGGQPHNRVEENELHDEMQELANLTQGGRRIFNDLIQMGIESLNIKHKKNMRTYESHHFDRGVKIFVNKHVQHYHPHSDCFYIPSGIGEYTILFPDN